MDINNNTNAEAINAAFTSLSLSPESDTEHTRIGVLYDISVHKSDLACIDAPASSGRARWANDVIVHLGDNISISTASSNKKHLLLIITPSELLSFTQHMFPNIDVVPILNLHKFGKSMGIPGMGLKKDEFKEAEFKFRLMFKVNDAMGHGLEGLHWNQAFYDIQKVKGIFAVNIAYYWMDTSSNNLNHPVVISIGMKMHKLFETVWPDAIFDGDPLSNTHQIEVPKQSNGDDCGFQSIELFRVLLPCKLQPFGNTTEFVKSTSHVTSDTINTARLNLKDNIQKLLQAKHQVSDVVQSTTRKIHFDTNVTIRTIEHTSNNTAALSTANQMDIDVDGLLDDVDTVVTHQELSCMALGELKELCKKKGLSTKGKMTKLIERYLEAQANGFASKKKQPVPPAKRMAKSRANRSDEKKQEDNKKTLAYNTKVRKGEAALNEWKRPTEDTKAWEIPGKDFSVDRHEQDVMTAVTNLYLKGSHCREWESFYLIAYIHVVNRFMERISDPSKLKIDDEKERADHVARVEEGLYHLHDLYAMSIKEKVTFMRFISESLDEGNENDYFAWVEQERVRKLMDRDESLMEWLVLSDEGLELVREIKQTHEIENKWLTTLFSAPSIDFERDIGPVSIVELDKSIRNIGSIRVEKDVPQWLAERLQQTFERYLKIHGYDVSWMRSIIGLRLSVPEWWWRGEDGGRYSKSSKLWKGEIVDVSLPDYKLDTYAKEDDPCRYFIFKCDEEDDNEYRMQYSDMWKFADDDQFDKFVLPKEMPRKYVDDRLHIFCSVAQRQLDILYVSSKLCTTLKDDQIQSVLDALEKKETPKGYYLATPDKILGMIKDKLFQRRQDENKILDNDQRAQIEKKFATRRHVLLIRHATEKVSDFIRTQKISPLTADNLMANFFRVQGRGGYGPAPPQAAFEKEHAENMISLKNLRL